MDDDEPDEESDAFIAKYSGLIDDLIGSDVSTEEAFRYSEMADQGEVFSPLDIERIVSDLFAIRIRYSLALIALNAINCLTKPHDKWRRSMKSVKSAKLKLEVMLRMMGDLDVTRDDEEDTEK